MELLARRAFNNGDMENAATLFASLARLHANGVSSHGHSQYRYFRYMSACCRVLATPLKVALPYRYRDLCHALLLPELTADFFIYPEEIVIENGTSNNEECQRTVLEHINKRFQQLVLCVHPDKNPHHRANEAFVRLRSLHEEAILLVNEYFTQERSERRASNLFSNNADSELGKRLRRKSHNSKRRKSKTSWHPHGMHTHNKNANSVSPSKFKLPELTTLKRQRITLKSLKRKQIDDNFQIFKDERKRRIRCNYRLSISMNSSHMFSDSDSDKESDNELSQVNVSTNKGKHKEEHFSNTTHTSKEKSTNNKKKKNANKCNSHLASTVPVLPVPSASSSFSSLPFTRENEQSFCVDLDDDDNNDDNNNISKTNKMFGLRRMSLKERIQLRRKKKGRTRLTNREKSSHSHHNERHDEEHLQQQQQQQQQQQEHDNEREKNVSKDNDENMKSNVVVHVEKNDNSSNINLQLSEINAKNKNKGKEHDNIGSIKVVNKRNNSSITSSSTNSPPGLSASSTSINDGTESDEVRNNFRARLGDLKTQLEKMRLANTAVHLTSDLSYAAYLREKVTANTTES